MPVPIPVAVWLFGSRLLGLIGIARRKYAGIATARRSPPKAKAIQSRSALRRKTTGSEFTPRFFSYLDPAERWSQPVVARAYRRGPVILTGRVCVFPGSRVKL